MKKEFFGAIAKSGMSDKRQVRVVVSTATRDRAGDVVEPSGIDLTAFKKNPVVLWAHDATRPPIARCVDIGLTHRGLEATAEFPPSGVSADSDTVRGLIACGVINAASVGFIALQAVAADPAKPYGGQRFLKSELCEFSFCAVPMNAEALILSRSLAGIPSPGTIGRTLEEIHAERVAQREAARARVAVLLEAIASTER